MGSSRPHVIPGSCAPRSPCLTSRNGRQRHRLQTFDVVSKNRRREAVDEERRCPTTEIRAGDEGELGANARRVGCEDQPHSVTCPRTTPGGMASAAPGTDLATITPVPSSSTRHPLRSTKSRRRRGEPGSATASEVHATFWCRLEHRQRPHQARRRVDLAEGLIVEQDAREQLGEQLGKWARAEATIARALAHDSDKIVLQLHPPCCPAAPVVRACREALRTISRTASAAVLLEPSQKDRTVCGPLSSPQAGVAHAATASSNTSRYPGRMYGSCGTSCSLLFTLARMRMG